MGTSEFGNSEEAEGAYTSDAPEARPDASPRGEGGKSAREVGAAFAGSLAEAAGKRTPLSCTAELIGLSVETQADFCSSMQPNGARMLLRANCGGASSEPVDLLLEIQPAPAFALVEAMLGGPDEGYLPDRPANDTELRLLSRVMIDATEGLLRAVHPQGHGPILVRFEQAPQQPRRPGESVLVVRVELTAGGAKGVLRMAVPPEICAEPIGRVRGDNLVQITVDAADADLSDEDLEHLAPGDILMTDLPADGEVSVRVAGIEKFVGKLAAGNGRRAVHITARSRDQKNG